MTEACDHLDQIRQVTPISQGCAACIALGDTWVHLRLCMVCGNVGCCNDSRNRHASRHFRETGHPIIQSFEPGEDWMWCYVDETFISPQAGDANQSRLLDVREFLRNLPIFAHLTEEHLGKLCEIAEPLTIEKGQLLMEEGSAGDAFYAIVEGEFEVIKRAGKGEVIMATRGPGDIVGEMSLLEDAPRIASLRALRDSRVLTISRAAFYDLLTDSPTVMLSILRTFIARLRNTEQLLVQNDKLASLGTLAAGLAHELNNPAAAAHRSTEQLREVLGRWQEASIAISMLRLSDDQGIALTHLLAEMEQRAAGTTVLDSLVRSDMETELQEWLEERGVDESWEVAPVLVSLGWGRDELEGALSIFAQEQLRVVVPWLSSGSAAYGLLEEVGGSAERISEIVKAVKTYSFLDQAPVQQVNIHEGLESTLTMLSYKLKQGVTIHREYDHDLPFIEAYGSELNQVWTNLIDNAVAAMGREGVLTLKTYGQGPNIVVEISDDGPGIPPEVQKRMFEPFFTTKEPGVGTGLGLHIVRNIVVDRHRGQVSVTSRPGYTCFQVTLPIRLARDEQG